MHAAPISTFLLALSGMVSAKYGFSYSEDDFRDSGMRMYTKVINGKITGTNYYPFISQLFRTDDGGSNFSFECTGSLIGSQYVVTAAHCVHYSDRTIMPAKAFGLMIGSAELATADDVQDFYNVTDIYVDGYRTESANDIAILKLDREVLPTVATPVKIYPYQVTSSLPVEVAGFGITKLDSTDLSQELMRALVSVSNSTQCEDFNSSWDNNSGPLICSINENGNDSCKGDSGGPLVAKLNGERTLVGITSWGVNMDFTNPSQCGNNTISYYVRAANFAKWAASTMGVDYTTVIQLKD
ncbi:Urokinase-type plasminogen activator [Smittium mucronatum]|uniref:Urokinase-type plasminogen activator n=1 Tax=Smittium mucronatum TaxID=133383 RepID=A0A1R0GW74_9FUNG|nr:Urokinase-type plasminogen activator [Smittium mucronatum]